MSSAWLIAVVPAICAVVAGVSIWQSWSDSAQRQAANSLAVLSGTLAALAILIPLGAIFLPNTKFGWQAWLLVGALSAATVCIFATFYSMIQLQKDVQFTTNQKLHVPASINATWIALALLSAAVVIAKFGAPTSQVSNDTSNATTQLRFTLVRDLPELGTSGIMIKQQWGVPAQENSSTLLYRTKNGLIAFCLDPQGLTRAIIETKETVDNVSKSVCQPQPTN